MSAVYAFHADAPEGRKFASRDDVPAGWVDTPAKLGKRDAAETEPTPKPKTRKKKADK